MGLLAQADEDDNCFVSSLTHKVRHHQFAAIDVAYRLMYPDYGRCQPRP